MLKGLLDWMKMMQYSKQYKIAWSSMVVWMILFNKQSPLKNIWIMMDLCPLSKSIYLRVNEDFRNITVSRLSVWQTAEPYYRRSRFLASKGMLRICFATFKEEEDAVDHGGPRREFFHLLIRGNLRDSSTLTGNATTRSGWKKIEAIHEVFRYV